MKYSPEFHEVMYEDLLLALHDKERLETALSINRMPEEYFTELLVTPNNYIIRVIYYAEEN